MFDSRSGSPDSPSQISISQSTPCRWDAACNDPDFRLKPLSVAIDELGASLAVSNDSLAADVQGTPTLSDDELVKWVFQLIQGPPDLPDRAKAFDGFSKGLRALGVVLRPFVGLSTAVGDLRASQILGSSADIPMRRPLAGRRTVFAVYDFFLALAEANSESAARLGAIAVASLVKTSLSGQREDRKLFKRASEQLVRDMAAPSPSPSSKSKWSRTAQQGVLTALREELVAACRTHYQACVTLGFSALSTASLMKRQVDPLLAFNRKLAKRWSACSDYMTPRNRQGVLGHGTLTVDLVREAGRLIRSGGEAGDKVQLVMSIEAIFNVTADLVAQIPVLAPGETNTSALLAVSLERKAFRLDMSWVIGTGATPSADTAHLYESTSQIYWVPMAPWLADALARIASSLGDATPRFVRDLVGEATHHPKADVLGGDGAYCSSVHRLRQSLPAIALQDGVPRMIAALALSQYGVVSPGRPYYGMVTGLQLDDACGHIYRRLGWLGRAERLPAFAQLCGSRVVPTRASIGEVFASLARSVEQADAEHRLQTTLQTWVARHRAIVAYVAAAAEFCLCLRDANRYVLDGLELSSKRRSPHVNDKAVHPLGGGPGSGKPALFVRLVQFWMSYLSTALTDRLLADDPVGLIIQQHARKALELRGHALLFGVDVHGNGIDVGDDAWLDMLPIALRLVENFGRHFWPCVCHQNGLGQRHLDYLLRHRLHAWEHATSVDPVPSARVRGELVAVLDKVIIELSLPIPRLVAIEEAAA